VLPASSSVTWGVGQARHGEGLTPLLGHKANSAATSIVAEFCVVAAMFALLAVRCVVVRVWSCDSGNAVRRPVSTAAGRAAGGAVAGTMNVTTCSAHASPNHCARVVGGAHRRHLVPNFLQRWDARRFPTPFSCLRSPSAVPPPLEPPSAPPVEPGRRRCPARAARCCDAGAGRPLLARRDPVGGGGGGDGSSIRRGGCRRTLLGSRGWFY